jgi:hypothetical protein
VQPGVDADRRSRQQQLAELLRLPRRGVARTRHARLDHAVDVDVGAEAVAHTASRSL